MGLHGMRTIRLYGDLAEFCGRTTLVADVATPAEAVRCLAANWPGLEAHMAERFYRVQAGEMDLALVDEPEQLHYPTGETEEIRIIPVVGGAKSGVWQILAGVALIALAFVPGVGAVAGAAFGTFTALGSAAFGIGASLVLGGVAQMIAPVPPLNGQDESDPRRNYSFSGIQNSGRSGLAVPLAYGEVLCGSIAISKGVVTDDMADKETD